MFAYSISHRDAIQPQTPGTHFSMQHSQDDAQKDKSDTNQTQADMECSVLSETSLPSPSEHRGCRRGWDGRIQELQEEVECPEHYLPGMTQCSTTEVTDAMITCTKWGLSTSYHGRGGI